MELWIRSQEKTKLIKVENIMIIENVIEEMTILGVSEKQTIQSEVMIIASDTLVGTYKTKERAIEVLTEIQNLLKPIRRFHKGEKYQEPNKIVDLTPNVVVYEMPEK